MAELAKIRSLFGVALGPAVAVLLLLLFVGYAVTGPSGLLAWGHYTRELKDKRAELRVVESRRAELANRVALADPEHADPDLVDELLRRKLNVLHPDEVVVPLN